MSILNGSSLTASAIAGLQNAFSALNTDNKGITMKNLTNVSAETIAKLGYNTTFLSYLTNNFSTLDKNFDGTITAKELATATNLMQTQGLTKSEIANLCSANSGSTLYQTVLDYFDRIDKNHDGRVTSEEISEFSYKSQRQKMDTKYNGYKASSASLFYSDDTTETPTSIVDGLYPDV